MSATTTTTTTCGDPSHADLLARLQSETELVARLQKRIIQLESQVKLEEEAVRNTKKRKLDAKQEIATKQAEVLSKDLNKIADSLPTPALRALIKSAEVVGYEGKVCLRFKRNDEPATLLWVSTLNGHGSVPYGDCSGRTRERLECEHTWRLCGVCEESDAKNGTSQRKTTADDEEKSDQPDEGMHDGCEKGEGESEDGIVSANGVSESEEDEDRDYELFTFERNHYGETIWDCDGLVDLLREWKAIPDENETELIQPLANPTSGSDDSPFHPLQFIEMPKNAEYNSNNRDSLGCTPHTYAFGSTLILWLQPYDHYCAGHGFDDFLEDELKHGKSHGKRGHRANPSVMAPMVTNPSATPMVTISPPNCMTQQPTVPSGTKRMRHKPPPALVICDNINVNDVD